MPRPKSTKKPGKPKADFPLTPHARGGWCKKIRSLLYPKGKIYYFGAWNDPDGALEEYLRIKEELQAGIEFRKVRTTGVLPLADAVNLYLHGQKLAKSDSGPGGSEAISLRNSSPFSEGRCRSQHSSRNTLGRSGRRC